MSGYNSLAVASRVLAQLRRDPRTVALILIAGRPILRALHRMSRRAAFDAPVAFAPPLDEAVR